MRWISGKVFADLENYFDIIFSSDRACDLRHGKFVI